MWNYKAYLGSLSSFFPALATQTSQNWPRWCHQCLGVFRFLFSPSLWVCEGLAFVFQIFSTPVCLQMLNFCFNNSSSQTFRDGPNVCPTFAARRGQRLLDVCHASPDVCPTFAVLPHVQEVEAPASSHFRAPTVKFEMCCWQYMKKTFRNTKQRRRQRQRVVWKMGPLK